MTPTASQAAAALRRKISDLTPGQIHRLLYLAQGHHLGWYSEPLFTDPVVVWDTGVVVPAIRGTEVDGPPGTGGLPNRSLTTVGYVTSRYGGLHLHDLDLLTRHSTPVVEAERGRRPGTSITLDAAAMAAYFASVDVDPDAPIIDAEWLAGFAARSRDRAAPNARRGSKVRELGNHHESEADARTG